MDVLSTLAALRRPRILVQAARCELDSYQRNAHLRRHLGPGKPPSNSAVALALLFKIEEDHNAARISREAGYSIARHVDVLAAMMGEARILRASLPEIVK